MKKRLFTIMLALVLLCSLCLAACGGKDDGVTQNPDGTFKGTLTIAISGQNAERDAITAFINAYNVINPDVKFTRVNIDGDYNEFIMKRNNSNTLPDVVFTYDDRVAKFAAEGVFAPLDEYMERDGIKEEDYFESVFNLAKPLDDGKVYFIPRDYDKIVTIFNTDMFQEAGIPIPTEAEWTWEKFKEVSQLMRQKMDENTNIALGLRESSFPIDARLNWTAVYNTIIKSYGGTVFDVAKGESGFSNAATQEALNEIKYLADNNLAPNPGYVGGDIFPSKGSSMAFGVRTILSTCNRYNLKLDFLPFPRFEGENVNGDDLQSYIGFGSSGFAVSAKSSKKDLAWDFCKFIISEAGQEAFSKTGDCVPVLKSMAEDPDATWLKYGSFPNQDIFIKHTDRDTPAPYLNGYNPVKERSMYDKYAELMVKLCGNYGGYGNMASFVDYANNEIKYLK